MSSSRSATTRPEYAKELVQRGAGNPPPIEAGEETHKYVLKPATARVLRAAAGRS